MYIIVTPVDACCMRNADNHSMTEDLMSAVMILLLLYLETPQYYNCPVNDADTANWIQFNLSKLMFNKITMYLEFLRSPLDVAKSHL